jgi:hypothetical protein
MGTRDYVAPEQADDPHSADIRADIYSLGATLCMLLTGRPSLHDGSPGDEEGIAPADQAPSLVQSRTDVPLELKTVLRRMMAKAPHDRYQTPAQVVDALASFVTPSETEATTIPTETVALPRVRPWRRTLIAVGVLLALVTAAIVILNGGLPPDPNKIVEVRRFHGHSGRVDCLTFSQSGEHLLSCGGRGDPRMRQWDVATGKLTRSSPAMDDVVRGMAIVPGEQRVITAQADGLVVLRDVATWEVVHQFHRHAHVVKAVAVSPDGELVLTGSYDGTARLFNISTTEEIRVFEEGPCAAVAISPDGRTAAHAWYSRVHVWEVQTGATIARMDRRGAMCGALAFSPDGHLLASGDHSGGTRVWDAQDGREVRTFPTCDDRVWSIAFLQDGRHVAVGSQDKTLRIFEVATGTESYRVDCDTYCTNHLAISPDGCHIATAGGYWHEGTQPQRGVDFTIRLWRLPKHVWPKQSVKGAERGK